METYLSPSRFIDSDHPAVVEFAEKNRGTHANLRDQAVSLYLAVREACLLYTSPSPRDRG